MKRWFSIGFGFGVGAALTVLTVTYLVSWYRNRPRPWNDHAFKIEFSRVSSSYSYGYYNYVTLDYKIENLTGNDYTFYPREVMVYDGDTTQLIKDKYILEPECYIPMGGRATCSIKVSGEPNPVGRTIEGFVLYDKYNRYQVRFPKPYMR